MNDPNGLVYYDGEYHLFYQLQALDTALNELNAWADLLAHATLVAAGFRQHKRGEWRKRRGNRKRVEHQRSDRPQGNTHVTGAGAGAPRGLGSRRVPPDTA